MVLTGSVGDGPVVAADISVTDADEEVVVTGTSDAMATYEIHLPANTRFPLTVRATGGTDLVTGRAVEFTLEAVTIDPGKRVLVNLSPITTLAARGARCLPGGVSAENLASVRQIVQTSFAFGLDARTMADPVHTEVNSGNAAAVLLANEALGETIRRAHAALAATTSGTDFDTLVDQIACDMSDGQLDGVGGDVRTAMTFHSAAIEVALEVIAGRLQVDGQNAVGLLDSALTTVLAGQSTESVTDVPMTASMLDQALSSALSLLTLANDATLAELAILLADATPDTARALLSAVYDTATQVDLAVLTANVALAEDTALDAAAARVTSGPDAPAPALTFRANRVTVDAGNGTRLSWSSANADVCLASGDWVGTRSLSGTVRTGALVRTAVYALSCAGIGGTVSGEVTVTVTNPAPPGVPTVTLNANSLSVTEGNTVRLSWTSTDANTCTASDGWSGVRPVSGNSTVGPLFATTRFSLTCSGAGGVASAQATITVTPPPPPAPTVSLTAAPVPVASGGFVDLSWNSTDATSCQASRAWSGPRAVSGSARVGPIVATSTFQLTCTGAGGSASDTVRVTLLPGPSVSLSATPPGVASGGTSTLDWISTGADTCTASGGWSGVRETSGSAGVGPITQDTTYTLTCNGPGGNAVAMTTVSVRSARLSWQAPTQNADGSTLTDLVGFTVHYGPTSRRYIDKVDINDPNQTQVTIILPPGTWHFAVTARNAKGNASGYSNEASKTIN